MIDLETAKKLSDRLLRSRMRLLSDHGFYGLLLMHAVFNLDEALSTAATDGERIYFSPQFLSVLSDDELDFVLMHEVLHIALGHIFRDEYRDPYFFNVACDIVVNSNIMLERGATKAIMLKNFGPAMHLAPDGNEGHLYTAEQVYDMLVRGGTSGQGSGNSQGNGKSQGNANQPGTASGNSGQSASGEMGQTVGDGSGRLGQEETIGDLKKAGRFDSHGRWQKAGSIDKRQLEEIWRARVQNAATAVEIHESSSGAGKGSMLAKRLLKEMRKSKLDWREILANFVQEDICDYSFSPPDRRFDGGDFFMPDFNEKEENVKNVWFVVDTSGSISDKELTAAYSEIVSAIEQFSGHIEGMLSFFEGAVTDPIPFSTVDDILKIRPVGGGGTSFANIFAYLNDKLKDEPPASIVIITDGYDFFPDESVSNEIPVLWLLNNDIVTPPWGKIARIEM